LSTVESKGTERERYRVEEGRERDEKREREEERSEREGYWNRVVE
jgi:hypothetical protein